MIKVQKEDGHLTFLGKILISYHHTHLMRLIDMATGVSEIASVPVTGWKYKCLICGKEVAEITSSGTRQLREGHTEEEVLEWFSKQKN